MSTAPSSSHDDTQPVYTWLLWIGVVALAFIQVFVSFRGLDSPAGMDQAQIARELAAGRGFSSQVIRPMALQQLTSAGKQVDLTRIADTAQPPVQPLILAPLFKVLEKKWSFDLTRRIYLLDRVIACTGAVWMLLTLVLTHGIARRMFDRAIATFTVMTLALCYPLWEMAVGGSSRALLMFVTTLFFHRLVEAVRRETSGETVGFWLMLGFAILAGVMSLTHWMGAWLAAGLIIALLVLLPSVRWGSFLAGAVVLGCVIGWAVRNQMAGGDPLGMFKATLLSVLTPDLPATHMRDFSGTLPAAFFGTLVQRLNSNIRDILANCYPLLMGSIPALLAVVSLLHRFRNPVVNAIRTATFLAWMGVVVGAVLFGGQKDEVGDEQIHAAVVPMLTMLGLAVLAVLWARLATDKRSLWTDYGYAFVAVLISSWPMLSGLYQGVTMGLFYKDRQINWPPYMPDRTALLNSMTKPTEIIITDQPWAVAWYADRAAVWLPKSKEQYAALVKEADKQQHPVAGMVISPLSSMEDRLFTQMTGPFGAWADIIFRTPVLGFGVDLGDAIKDSPPFKAAFPLAGSVMPDGRLVPSMIFYSDRVRWDHLK